MVQSNQGNNADRGGAPLKPTTNWIFVGLAAVLAIVAAWQIRLVLLLMFASMILVIFFTIPIRWLTSLTLPVGENDMKISRGAAIALTVLGFFVVLSILWMLVFPTLAEQFAELAQAFPQGIDQIRETLTSEEFQEQNPIIRDLVNDPRLFSEETINQIVTQVLSALGQFGGSVLPLVGGVANTLLSILIVLFLSMYLLAEPQVYIDRIVRYTPIWYRHRMIDILHKIDQAIRAWLGVTGASMLVVGLLTGLGLSFLGIEEWVALGVLAGLASFIPNFGPLVALVPTLAVGVLQVPDRLLWVVVVVYVVSFIQSQVISPILANEHMKLPPVAVLVGQVVFGIFFGFLGIMFAVPLTAIFLLLLDEVYVKDVLGDTGEEPIEPPPTIETDRTPLLTP